MITLALFAEELWKQFLVKNKYKQWIPQVKENSPTSSRENCYKNVSSKLQWVKVLLKQTEFTHAVISFNQSHYFLWIREKKSSNWENPSVKMTTWSVTFRQECIYYDILHICYFYIYFHCPALGNKGAMVWFAWCGTHRYKNTAVCVNSYCVIRGGFISVKHA